MSLIWAYFVILILPGVVITANLPKSRFNVLDRILLTPLIGASVSVVTGSVLTLIGVKLTSFAIYATYVVFGVIALVILVQVLKAWKRPETSVSWQNRAHLYIKENWHYLIIGLVTVMAVAAKVAPGLLVYAPPLHDPAAHAEWASSILETGRVTYFYSSGLHLLTVFSTTLSGLPIPKHLIYITNFFNGYAGVGLFLFIWKVFKDRFWALTAGALMAFGAYPTLFYVTAGKDTLVVALTLLPVAMLFGYDVVKQQAKTRLTRYLIPSLTLTAIFLIHYPTTFIFLMYMLGLTLSASLKKPSVLLELARSYVVGLVILFAWSAAHYGYYVAEYAQRVDVGITSKFAFTMPTVTSFLATSSRLATWIASFDVTPYSIFTVAGILGACVIFSVFKEARFLLGWAILFFAGLWTIEVFQVSSLGAISETAVLSTMVFLVIGSSAIAALFFRLASRSRGLQTIYIYSIVVIGLFISVHIYGVYIYQQTDYKVVNNSDIAAFDWIGRNINERDIILNNAVLPTKYLFGTDSGYWIPGFTGRHVAMSFINQCDKNAQDTFKLYERMKQNPNDAANLRRLTDKGIRYFFIGSRAVFGPAVDPETFAPPHYRRVYARGGVYIFRIGE